MAATDVESLGALSAGRAVGASPHLHGRRGPAVPREHGSAGSGGGGRSARGESSKESGAGAGVIDGAMLLGQPVRRTSSMAGERERDGDDGSSFADDHQRYFERGRSRSAAARNAGLPITGGDREYLRNAQVSAAEAHFDQTHLTDPSNEDAWVAHAKHILHHGSSNDGGAHAQELPPRSDRALHILAAALEANPASTTLWVVYIWLFDRRGCTEETAELCAIGCSRAPSHSLWLLYLRLALPAGRRILVAEEAMRWTMALPTDPEAAAGLAATELRSQRLVELTVLIAVMEERRGNASRGHAIIRAVASGSTGRGLAAALAPATPRAADKEDTGEGADEPMAIEWAALIG